MAVWKAACSVGRYSKVGCGTWIGVRRKVMWIYNFGVQKARCDIWMDMEWVWKAGYET